MGIANIWHGGSTASGSVLSVIVQPTNESNSLAVSVRNVSGVALQLEVSRVAGLSRVSVQDIWGSPSHTSRISMTDSSLQSLNISRVDFNLGGSVNVIKSEILED